MSQSILLTTYHEAFLHRGGGEYEMLEIAINLRKQGFVADIYGPYSRDIEHYDVVLHFSIESSGLSIAEHAKCSGKKLILWPNFWIDSKDNKEVSKVGKKFVALADLIVFKSLTEKTFFEERIPLQNTQTLIVPCGVDAAYTKKSPQHLFQQSFNLKKFILWVGIIEPRKNQLRTIQALHDLPIPLVFIGNYRKASYYEACKKAAPDHFRFLAPMRHKSDIFRAALQECKLYIEPSLDPPGKSILEAAVAGANVLTCKSDWSREHFGDNACYVDPKDTQSIQEGVQQGLTMKSNPALTQKLTKRHAFPSVLQPLCTFLENK